MIATTMRDGKVEQTSPGNAKLCTWFLTASSRKKIDNFSFSVIAVDTRRLSKETRGKHFLTTAPTAATGKIALRFSDAVKNGALRTSIYTQIISEIHGGQTCVEQVSISSRGTAQQGMYQPTSIYEDILVSALPPCTAGTP